jgi:hypothetical protein
MHDTDGITVTVPKKDQVDEVTEQHMENYFLISLKNFLIQFKESQKVSSYRTAFYNVTVAAISTILITLSLLNGNENATTNSTAHAYSETLGQQLLLASRTFTLLTPRITCQRTTDSGATYMSSLVSTSPSRARIAFVFLGF